MNSRVFAAAAVGILVFAQAPAAALRCRAACARDAVHAAVPQPACHGEGRAPDPAPSGHSCRSHLAPCVLSGTPAIPAVSSSSAAGPALAAPSSFAGVRWSAGSALALRPPRSFESPPATILPSVRRL